MNSYYFQLSIPSFIDLNQAKGHTPYLILLFYMS